MARVTDSETMSGALVVTNREKQSCVLAPISFSLASSAVLMDACLEKQPVTSINYRIGRVLFSCRRLKASSRIFKAGVQDLLLANACALNITTGEDMQRSVDLSVSGCSRFRAQIDLVEHPHRQFNINTTAPPPTANISIVTPAANATTSTKTATASPTIRNRDSIPTGTHCDRTFTSCNDLAGHLRTHRAETGEPTPAART
nr:unnamed protein product [Spirometra erinaceieuropaei]